MGTRHKSNTRRPQKNPRVTRRIPRLGVRWRLRRRRGSHPYGTRADVWADLGGFDESLALSGEPGIGSIFTCRCGPACWAMRWASSALYRSGASAATGRCPRLRKQNCGCGSGAEIGARIRAVAGCRWPPEVCRRGAVAERGVAGTEAPRHGSSKARGRAEGARFQEASCSARPPSAVRSRHRHALELASSTVLPCPPTPSSRRAPVVCS